MINVQELDTSRQVAFQLKTSSPQLFDVRSACDYLKSIGVSAATISSTRTIFGQVPHIRIGKRFYVSKQSLDTWIENRRRRSKS